MRLIGKLLFNILVLIGKPFGGIRPRRIYSWLANFGYPNPEFRWVTNAHGHCLFLSPFYALDRAIICTGAYNREIGSVVESIVQPGDICLDIGANIGEVSLLLAELVKPHGKVYALEPVGPVFKRLEEHVTKNRLESVIQPVKVAISNRSGTVRIRYADVLTENQGMGSLVDDEPLLTLTETVDVVTLDDFVIKFNITQINFIKADIQGAEPYMLEGGQRVFSEFSPDIIMEVAPGILRKIAKKSSDLFVQLRDYGYGIFSIKKGKIGSQVEPEDDFAGDIFCTKKMPRP